MVSFFFFFSRFSVRAPNLQKEQVHENQTSNNNDKDNDDSNDCGSTDSIRSHEMSPWEQGA